VIAADKHLDTEVSCEDPTSQKDWVTNEVYFGVLPEGGLIVDTTIAHSQKLVAKNCPVFAPLGQHLKPFEVAIGVNGRAYVRTGETDHLRAVLVAEVLRKSESMKEEELEALCQEMERRLKHYCLD
jgi:exosome complex RNA-binding protein Rrp4